MNSTLAPHIRGAFLCYASLMHGPSKTTLILCFFDLMVLPILALVGVVYLIGDAIIIVTTL